MASSCSVQRSGAIVCAAFLSVASAFGGEPSPVRAMLEESGVVEHFRVVAQMYPTRLRDAARLEGLSSEIGKVLADVGARAMDAARFADDLETALSGTLSIDEIAVMRDFYRSRLGSKVARVESRATTVWRRAEVQSRWAQLVVELNRNVGRKERFEQIDRDRHMAEFSAAVKATVIYAVSVGVLAGEEGEVSKETLTALESGMQGMQQALLPTARGETAVIFFDAYQRLSDRDLEVYSAFLATEEALAVHAKMLEAMKVILETRQREIAEDFLDFVRRDKG